MSFVTESSKLLTNKYFLYFMVFLSATNVLGYLVTNQTRAVIFFGLVSLITYQFSKNMSVILLIAVISTNFLMVNRKMREGLINENETEETEKTDRTLSTIKNIDPQIANTIKVLEENASEDESTIRQRVTDSQEKKPIREEVKNKVTDPNNSDLNTSTEEGPEGVGETIGGKKNSNTTERFGPRLDYAATIEQSYQNLDNILGSDSIKELTKDTQKLMAQQQTLFDTMQNMVPVLQGAQNLLKDFDIGGLTNSLKGIGGLGNAPIMAPGKKQ
jgi:hypothetical protein